MTQIIKISADLKIKLDEYTNNNCVHPLNLRHLRAKKHEI